MTKQLQEVLNIVSKPYELQCTINEYEKVKSYSFDLSNQEEYTVSLIANIWLFFHE